MSKVHLYLLALLLTVAGLSMFLYKALVLHFPLAPGAEVDIWNVEAKITFQALNEPVKVSLFIPRSTRHHAIMNDAFISRGYGLSTATDDSNRQAVWTVRKGRGQQSLYYRAEARRVETREPRASGRPPKIIKPEFIGPEEVAATALVANIRRRSADTDSMVAELIRRLNQPHPDDNVTLLLAKQTGESGKMDLAAQILALAGVPARVVHGIRLQEPTEKATLVHWLEVYDRKEWRAFNPVSGTVGVPENYLTWWRGPGPLVRLTGGEKLQLSLSVSRDQETGIKSAVVRGQIKKPLLVKFSLFSLPIHSQQVYRVLLMVPVGAFLMVVLRNVVGLSAFGTFMPVLIALAFRETQLLAGVVLFSLIVGLGLLIRFYLERLKLLVVPRLAAVLIVVVLLMACFSVLGHKVGLERGLSVALFPMVIMTMTIERMSIVWEERGPSEALKQGIGSIGAAALIYAVIHNREVQHLFFVFPELLLVLLAGTILLGRYSGYRLFELFRFRGLVKGPA